MKNTDDLEIFELACKYYSEKMSEFKEILETKVSTLDNPNWSFQKGSIKVCAKDETGRKNRFKVVLSYTINFYLNLDFFYTIWN